MCPLCAIRLEQKLELWSETFPCFLVRSMSVDEKYGRTRFVEVNDFKRDILQDSSDKEAFSYPQLNPPNGYQVPSELT